MLHSRYFLLSILSLSSHARPQIPSNTASLSDPAAKSAYGFTTYHCTDDQHARLTSVLQEIEHDMPSVIAEASKGTTSEYGFSPLFKTNDNSPAVQTLFQRIANSNTLSVGVITYPITFVCVNLNDEYTINKLKYWQAHPDVPAAGDSSTNDIFLFPLFWELERNPSRCPKLSGGKATPNDGRLVDALYGVVVHELADKYLHFMESRQQASESPEFYKIQECVDLPAEKQVANAQNFAMFACGESFPSVVGDMGELLLSGRRG
ncbi:uncharacterized protein KY384_001740 [Bacidia gigantensis]|uniref:uncharacterized protein n=1 Tax=Bacidia gigantensis TaxID=2732470 RepID=UPI001D03AD53|nr:uncharacterized protein KY384_001740 [Bacidia gigantensis]KAG8532959.1 hypothetical protein KY384_001740 [Bacidia gigantensis]